MSLRGVGGETDFSAHELPKLGEPSDQKEPQRTLHKQFRAVVDRLMDTGVHASNFLRLAWGIQNASNPSPEALRGIAGVWGPLMCCISVTGLISETARVSRKVHKLRKLPETTKKEYLKTLLMPLLPHRPLLRDMCALATGVLFSVKTLAKSASPAIGVASCVLGTVTGALTIVIGSITTAHGAKTALDAHKKVKELQKQMLKVEEDTPDQKVTLEKQLKAARWERTKGILKAASGVLVTVGGALLIASLFTSPAAPLLAIALTAIALSVASTAISAGVVIQERIHQGKPPLPGTTDLKVRMQQWVKTTKENWKIILDQLDSIRMNVVFYEGYMRKIPKIFTA